jgi:hypothetical protein
LLKGGTSQHSAPPIVMDTGQLASTSTPGGQPLTRTVTIDDATPFRVLNNKDVEVSLMSLQVFLTLQVLISGSTPTPPVRGPSGDVMETHRSVVLHIALGATDNFQTFLVNFFIVNPMLPYEAIPTWGESQVAVEPSPPC